MEYFNFFRNPISDRWCASKFFSIHHALVISPQNSKVNALCGGSHPVPSILHPARLKGMWLHPQWFFSNLITDFSYPHCFPFVPLRNCYTLLIQECFSLDGKLNFHPNRQFVHLRLVILVKRIFVMSIFGSLINFEEKVLQPGHFNNFFDLRMEARSSPAGQFLEKDFTGW